MTVTVHKVQAYNIATDELQVSRRMATIAGARIVGGDIIEGTEVEIDESQLEPGRQWTARNFNPHSTGGIQRQVSRSAFKSQQISSPAPTM
jgi:hypothetical protein